MIFILIEVWKRIISETIDYGIDLGINYSVIAYNKCGVRILSLTTEK